MVVSLTDQAIVKEDHLLDLAGDLLAIFEAGYPRIVLDFSQVERVSSRAVARIGEVMSAGFGSEARMVKVSGIRPELAAVFAMTGLDPRVASYPDTASAVSSLWPEQPEFRPLPVSILAALMRDEDARSQGYNHPNSTSRDGGDAATMNTSRLIFQDGTPMGRSFAIKGARFLIGRGSDCQLRLASAAVSRSHAVIESRGGRLFLRDLASKNGTFLNGRPLRDTRAEIRDGDRVQIGKAEFALSITPIADPLGLPGHPDHGAEGDDSDYQGRLDAAQDLLDTDDQDAELGLKYEVIEETLVVTPLASELADEAVVDGFRDALLSLYERRLPRRVVVNLAHVGYLSSRAIGILVSHHMRLDRSGGALRLCLANPRVAVALDQVKIGMLIECRATLEDAVISAWHSASTSIRP